MVQAQQIKEHMEVCGADGAHIGTVDCTKDSNKIVLNKSAPNPAAASHYSARLGREDRRQSASEKSRQKTP